MIPLFLLFIGIAYAAGRSNQYVTPNASMSGEVETVEVSPPIKPDVTMSLAEYEEEKRIKAAIKSRNPRAMVRLAMKLEKKYPRTSRVLVGRAIREEEKQDKEKKIAIPSPINSVPSLGWGRYVRLMGGGSPGPGRVGVFGLSLRRLADLGYISKIEGDTAEWKEGLTPEDFEEDIGLQYVAFAKSAKDHAKVIKTTDHIGRDICGEKATLSGLMAVAHYAGMPAYHKWVESDSDKEKFPATTQAYQKANGIF